MFKIKIIFFIQLNLFFPQFDIGHWGLERIEIKKQDVREKGVIKNNTF